MVVTASFTAAQVRIMVKLSPALSSFEKLLPDSTELLSMVQLPPLSVSS